ncbi:hypothetical protein HNR57_004971 [Streptomyces paradoxus]|uniref:Uncharacterized protein n=1 Tax=Streptomyces paradoxus TaxID=66375 RepID=A0A7W9TE95_9ACTN|nr:hypothetical protein [Streptomyces paradoxus]
MPPAAGSRRASVSWISPPRPGGGALQDGEDVRVEDVAADDGVPARCVLPGRLLDQARDADDALLGGRLDGGAAVAVDLPGR